MHSELKVTEGGRKGAIRTLSMGQQTARIFRDEHPENPREDLAGFGTMACFHRRYTLGDKAHGIKAEDYRGWDEMEQAILRRNPGALILPLYLYDHSGITMRTVPFSCPWDSGQVGFIFATREKVLRTWGAKRMTERIRNLALEALRSEVEEYDAYLTGDVYGYIVEDQDGEELDSCWGFIGLQVAEDSAASSLRFQHQIAA